ncbi:hypothetical protein H5410_002730 [Solanum commersonii]|uniref:Uncharacterized protein n=1 Tax=Solanum commersonii TaxID=4109 RepID=A0A9J6B2N3_SOLCO|nr:hypothetical protein H5410_002730 [Solanum commersonii]
MREHLLRYSGSPSKCDPTFLGGNGLTDHAMSFSATVEGRFVIVVQNTTSISQIPEVVITPWNNLMIALKVPPANPPIIHVSTTEMTPLTTQNHVVSSFQNSRGGNKPEFRRNFRSLMDWNKAPLVALIETKMENHQELVDDFPFNRMIQVPVVGNFGGMVVLWDDTILALMRKLGNPQSNICSRREPSGRCFS